MIITNFCKRSFLVHIKKEETYIADKISEIFFLYVRTQMQNYLSTKYFDDIFIGNFLYMLSTREACESLKSIHFGRSIYFIK